VGCGAGRHSFEAFRRGADVVAFDQSVEDLNDVDAILQAMQEKGEAPPSAKAEAVKGDALDLPYDDGTFDFVIASVHSGFKMGEADMTKRLVKVLENPHTTMLGHMTGRLLLAREGYAFNLDKVLETAAKHQKIIEINANPHRFDIDWRWIKKAASLGVKFSINPDAHSPEGLKDTAFGVGIARKGWLTKKEVVNTMTLAEMEKFLG
jgi:DNA polymerase (family 10)